MELIFLGTSSMVPTKDRNVQGIFLSYKNEGILIDCGEGTQRQMNIAGINRNRVTRVLISHWHGDHVSGLLGLMQTLGNSNPAEIKTLYLYGPRGTKERLNHLMKSIIFENKIKIVTKEIDAKKPTTFFETEDFEIQAANLIHGAPVIGFRFVEKQKRKMVEARLKKLGISGPNVGKLQQGNSIKIDGKTIKPGDVGKIVEGKTIAFILDTGLCANCYELAKDADVLVSEATFTSELEEKAHLYKHLTARDAALIATKANAEKLILTHLSQRYKTPEDILHDARDVFPNSEVAFDFMKVKL
ncbi:MAG: ribonuclease Z [Candidatus Ranarchaeia archaeon]